MKILSAKQMNRWDRLSIQKHRISANKLMRNAARACFDCLGARGYLRKGFKFVIVCGPGNNGGDGFCLAGILSKKGLPVDAYFIGDVKRLSDEARVYYESLSPAPVVIEKIGSLKSFRSKLKTADVIVDGLFGTGLNRRLTGVFAGAVKVMNQSSAFKISIDMPSGVSGETGVVMGAAFKADLTVTFEVPKWGQLQPEAWDYVGELEVVSIGLRRSELAHLPAKAEWIDRAWVAKRLARRSRKNHKGSAGSVLVLAGSTKMPGAGYLTSLAALRAGSGLVTWAMPEEAFKKISLRHPEVILQTLPSRSGLFAPMSSATWQQLREDFQALAVGPGLGRGGDLTDFLEQVLSQNKLPLVLDADALNLIAANHQLLKHLKGAVLTPHPKEMSRLCGISVRDILKDRVKIAGSFAKKYRLWVLLKGYRTVMCGPGGETYINSTGGPNLATAGSGDVLTGTIASMMAQGHGPLDAMTMGAYLHGRAGDRLAGKMGDRGTLASEIADELPKTIRELLKKRHTGKRS